MADRASRYAGGWEEQATPSSAIGFILFAAVMMILVGIFQGVAGLVALVNDNFFLAPANTCSSSTSPRGDGST